MLAVGACSRELPGAEQTLDQQLAAGATQIVMMQHVATDEDLARIAKLPAVTSLRLDHAAITDTGVAQLTALPKLELLRLSGDKLTDGAMVHVGKIASLRYLIVDAPITDTGLAPLTALPNLDSLYLLNTKTTADGVDRLQKLRPELHVHD